MSHFVLVGLSHGKALRFRPVVDIVCGKAVFAPRMIYEQFESVTNKRKVVCSF